MLYKMRLLGLAMDPFNNTPIVILRRQDEDEPEEDDSRDDFKLEQEISLSEEKVLPIWIGEPEAQAIASVLLNVTPPRPMTHDLMKNIIVAMGGEVKRVIITDLKDNTFYAVIEIAVEDGDVLVIDSRPSDALALALRFEVPIFAEEKVLEKNFSGSEHGPSVLEKEFDEEAKQKWAEMIENLTAQSLKKYKQ